MYFYSSVWNVCTGVNHLVLSEAWKRTNSQSCIKYSTSKYQYQYQYQLSKYQYKYQYLASKYKYKYQYCVNSQH